VFAFSPNMVIYTANHHSPYWVSLSNAILK
jgi:hypothetical protein